jgi:outer membrane protein assembly factor BamB
VDGLGYVVGEGGEVAALDAATGHVVWSTSTAAVNEALPAVANGALYVATNDGRLVAFDSATGDERWHAPISGVPVAPVVVGGLVLVPTSGGTLFAIGDPLP